MECIYIIKNNKNDKYYIGQTTHSIHKSLVYKSIYMIYL